MTKKMTYKELREMWFSFFREKGHTIIPSAPVIPENDPSTLFTTAGMQPLVPFLLGEKHPAGTRIANIQRCIRTNDIDEVGDISHLTFFEMMGNWSLGDYFKNEKVAWSYELLTSPKYLGIDKNKIHVTVFEGDNTAPRDNETAEIWKKQGIPAERIHFFNKNENWWAMSSGLGPQGPDSEMFIHNTDKCNCKNCKCNPAENCGCFTELGNDVYMQYVGVNKDGKIKIETAKQKNVDTGWGLERILCFVNGLKSVYETELFAPAIEILEKSGVRDERARRIIAEHVRASAVIINDGVVPSNSGAGYVLRRLIRRAVRNAYKFNVKVSIYSDLLKFYNGYLEFNLKTVVDVFMNEVERFEKTLANGIKEFEKIVSKGNIDGKTAFYLYETYGFPIELTEEMAREKGHTVDRAEYDRAKNAHSDTSRNASATAGMFKGGLASGDDVMNVRYHTCAHLLLAVLRKTFGDDVVQKGSNITPERLRYDFSLNRKIEPAELCKIENEVNEIIKRNLEITCVEMPKDDARKSGAVGTFWDKYGAVVKVYTIGSGKNIVSREICGGPHVGNTSELGKFKIQKEEAVGQGVRRIKAILE